MPDIKGNYPIHYLIKFKNKDGLKKWKSTSSTISTKVRRKYGLEKIKG